MNTRFTHSPIACDWIVGQVPPPGAYPPPSYPYYPATTQPPAYPATQHAVGEQGQSVPSASEQNPPPTTPDNKPQVSHM